jgi:hypothetical protein
VTTRSAFSAEEWQVVAEAPTSAGMIVMTASSGGTFSETFAMSKAYAEARAQHGGSELLNELVGTKPKLDKTHYPSPAEMRTHALQHVRDAVGIVGAKATAQEADDYRRFVLSVAQRVALAHDEHGEKVSSAEADAIHDLEAALGVVSG